MKKLFLLLVIIAGIGLSWTFIMKKEVESRYSLTALQRIADGANKNLPVMIDKLTRLEKVSASDNVLEKHYTFTESEISDLDLVNVKSQLSKILVEQSCANAQSTTLYKNGVSEWFTYQDRNGENIVTIKIGLNDCKL